MKCLELIEVSPEIRSGKPNEVITELMKNGINCTNVKKILLEFKI